MKWSWYYVAHYVVELIYGGYVNYEEEYFECPECGEPIYKCDYPYVDCGMMCPVCECECEDAEEENE